MTTMRHDDETSEQYRKRLSLEVKEPKEPEVCAFCYSQPGGTCTGSDGMPCCYDCSKLCQGCGDNPMAPEDDRCQNCLEGR